MSDTVDLAAERKARIDKALAALSELDPSWAQMFNSYVLSGMYERNVIDQKTRELCAVSALTVLDRANPLKDHIKGAFRQGATDKEILEVIFQASVYGGMPTTLSALNHYRDVVKEIAANS